MREVTPLRGHTPTSPRPYEATPYEATPLRGHAHYDAAALRGHFPTTPHPFEATPLRGRAPECDQSGPLCSLYVHVSRHVMRNTQFEQKAFEQNDIDYLTC